MDSTKYIGMDVHKETVSIAVMNSAGKLVVESILETKAAIILQFIQGLRATNQNDQAAEGKRQKVVVGWMQRKQPQG